MTDLWTLYDNRTGQRATTTSFPDQEQAEQAIDTWLARADTLPARIVEKLPFLEPRKLT